MCTVSVVIASAQRQLPPLTDWDYGELQDFQRVIQLLDRIDRKLGSAECKEDKAVFKRMLADRLAALEEGISQR